MIVPGDKRRQVAKWGRHKMGEAVIRKEVIREEVTMRVIAPGWGSNAAGWEL